MIRCSCGEFAGNACLQAEHKQIQSHPDEHKIVCSNCGERFSTYPIDRKEAVVGKAIHDNSLVWVLCRNCSFDMLNSSLDIVDAVMDFEEGNMSEVELVNFFQKIIQSGVVWNLQGVYGRIAVDLIERGWCYRVDDIEWIDYKESGDEEMPN